MRYGAEGLHFSAFHGLSDFMLLIVKGALITCSAVQLILWSIITFQNSNHTTVVTLTAFPLTLPYPSFRNYLTFDTVHPHSYINAFTSTPSHMYE